MILGGTAVRMRSYERWFRHRSRILVTLLAFLEFGCSSTNVIHLRDSDTNESVSRFSYLVQSSDAEILLKNGSTIEVDGPQVYHDSVKWSVGSPGAGIPIDSVEQITGRNHVLGALEGFGIGALAGGILAALMLESGGHPGVSAPLVGGVLGAGVGSLIGALIGHRYRFTFDEKPK